MKKTLLLFSLLGGATTLIGQGQINLQSYVTGYMNNGFGFSTTIYSEDYVHPGEAEIMGDTVNDIPAGHTVYQNESPLGGTTSGSGAGPAGEYNGNNYTVGFYFATSASALQAALNSGVPGYSILMGTIFGAGGSGIYDSLDAPIIYTIPNDPAGTPTYLAMAAWYSGGGAGSYASAVAANVPRGSVFATNTFTPTVAPYAPPNLGGLGLTSFNLVVSVPEPNIIALGVTTGLAFLFRHRKGTSQED